MFYFLLLIFGFFPLIFGANLLVDGASSLAKKFNIPNIVIGLTIVAFGTSAPEMVVNVFASINKNSSIVLGNIVGSNIFNVLGILGISAIVFPLTVKTNTTWKEIPLSLLSAVLLLVAANDLFLEGRNYSEISRIDGILFLAFFIIFLAYNAELIKSGRSDEEITIKDLTKLISTFFIITGIILLVVGGRLVVLSSIKIARSIGISERIIALTIISIGTSLPELATSVVAALKRNVDIAVGNVVGSNIFNIFLILGLSAVINPIELQQKANFEILINILAGLLLFIFVFTGKGRKIDRWEGAILLLVLVFYFVRLIIV